MPVPPASVNSSASATPFTISLTRLSSVEHLVCSWAILPSDATEICFHSLHFTPWMINEYAVSFPSFPLRLCIPFFLHPSERLWHVTVQQWNYVFFFFGVLREVLVIWLGVICAYDVLLAEKWGGGEWKTRATDREGKHKGKERFSKGEVMSFWKERKCFFDPRFAAIASWENRS